MGGVVLKALNDDFRVSKHQKGANVTRTEVSGKVEGINTSNKFCLIGGSKRCSGGEASDFFSKMVYNSARAPLEWDSTRNSIDEDTERSEALALGSGAERKGEKEGGGSRGGGGGEERGGGGRVGM